MKSREEKRKSKKIKTTGRIGDQDLLREEDERKPSKKKSRSRQKKALNW